MSPHQPIPSLNRFAAHFSSHSTRFHRRRCKYSLFQFSPLYFTPSFVYYPKKRHFSSNIQFLTEESIENHSPSLQKNIPEIPYASADFKSVSKLPFYMDRTHFIPQLESAGKFLIFLRPRLTGKTLLIDTLQKYYDVLHRDEFKDLFGHLQIGANPTPLANQYLVFRIDFSALGTDTVDDFKRAMNNSINTTAVNFAQDYVHIVPELLSFEKNAHDAADTFTNLCKVVKRSGQKMMVLVDEYDNAVNKALSRMDTAIGQRGDVSPSAAERQESIFKTFFTTLKQMTPGAGPVDRIFITGVSPIALNDFTSGFNIATALSMEPEFATLAGFTEGEVKRALQLVLIRKNDVNAAFKHFRTFYNGYSFSARSDERMYTSQLVLYALRFIRNRQSLPIGGYLVDRNVLPSEYAMQVMLSHVAGREAVEKMLEVDTLNTKGTSNGLVQVGCLDETPSTRDLLLDSDRSTFSALAFLYHMGAITQGVRSEHAAAKVDPALCTLFKVPNQVVKKMFLDALLKRMNMAQVDFQRLHNAVVRFVEKGDLQELCECMEYYCSLLKGPDMKHQSETAFKMPFLVALASSRYARSFENEIRLSDEQYAEQNELCLSFPQHGVLMELKDVRPGYLSLHGEYINMKANPHWDDIRQFSLKVQRHCNEVMQQCAEEASVETFLQHTALEVNVYDKKSSKWRRVPLIQVWEDAKKQALRYAQSAANRHNKSFTAYVAMRVGYYKVIQGVAGKVEPKV